MVLCAAGLAIVPVQMGVLGREQLFFKEPLSRRIVEVAPGLQDLLNCAMIPMVVSIQM